MQTVLITGSNGLIASKIIELLAQQTEWKVIATSRNFSRWTLPTGVRFELLDITNPTEIEYLVGLYTPSYIINTAAITKPDACEISPDECWKINTIAVQNLTNICNKHSIHLVQFSSDFIFDGTATVYTEEHAPTPLSVYARSKAEADAYIIANSKLYSIIRTSLVYGMAPAVNRSNLIGWVKDNLEAKKPIKVVCDQYRTPTLAEDIARGILLLLEKRETGIFNLSGRDYMSVYEIAIKVALHFGLNPKYIHEVETISLNEPATRPRKTFLSIEKARKVLDYNPLSFEEGLQVLKTQMKLTEPGK